LKQLQIIKHTKLWFTISLLFLVPGIIAIALGWLKPGIDFVGGTLMELRFTKPAEVAQVYNIMTQQDKELYKDAKIQINDEGVLVIRTKPIDNKQQTFLLDTLKKDLGEFETRRIEVVGPTIGEEIFKNSMWGFILVVGGIVLYLSFRFKYDYAISGIIALVHDVVFLVGIFAIFGKVFGTEIDSLFITAALTVAGFSVHDTIVVFDRVRENIKNSKRGTPIGEIANNALNQTMARSINTSLTTLITLVMLFLFGGESIKDFVLAMIIGITAGTYSSIFVATPLLVVWREFEQKEESKEKQKHKDEDEEATANA